MQGVKSKNTPFLFKQISHLHTHTLAHTFSLLGNEALSTTRWQYQSQV